MAASNNTTAMVAPAGDDMGSTGRVCTDLPPNVHSGGILHYKDPSTQLPFTFPNLEMQIVLIFVITQSIHFVLRKFGIHKFPSQIIAGIILSSGFLGKAYMSFLKYVFSAPSQELLGVMAELGYGLFFFLIAVKMDLGMIRRTGHKALSSGIACVLVPLVITMSLQTILLTRFPNLSRNEIRSLPLHTVIHCSTPFPVVALLLDEMKLLNSELGRLSLSSSLVSDTISGLLIFAALLAKQITKMGIYGGVVILSLTIVSLVILVGAIRPAMFWVIRQTPENRPVNEIYIYVILITVLGIGIYSHILHLGFHFGPFLFGLAVPAGPPLGSAIEDKLNVLVSDVLLPLFVTICSMRTDFSKLSDLTTNSFSQISAIIILIALVTKFISSLFVPLYCKMPFKDALALALILSYKGILQLSHYTQFHDFEVMNDSTFTMAMISVLLTSIFVPKAVKILYDPSRKYAGYERRNVMHLNPNDELKILSCIHKSANISGVINLLDAACPSKQNPITLSVLNLIELVGRSSPIFISHQIQSKSVSNTSYSENVILYFNQFVRENPGAVSLNIYTAISPAKFMHEDICTLALDKLASLILLPFHRKWLVDGSVGFEDNVVRNLNCSVLDRAPCSVGILVDRSNIDRETSIVAAETCFSAAVIFLGGKDDREALAFAKRMANEPTIHLTVIRIVAADQEGGGGWDEVLDKEELKGFRRRERDEVIVTYLEEVVKDGTQTAYFLRPMMDDYDLIIVGRRDKVESPQTAGLSEWNEFPELGTIGDLLASQDFDCKASILVVQQQTMATQ